ncbi:MAG TPA: protein kinase [Acidobacteriota bacterium]|nr:protein kinase [Acidobacteriota bacterium]
MVQKLGKYTIVEKLGEGAMGAVYKAYDAVLDRHVAIKTMAEEIKWDPELKLRFYREARSAANLHHPNIVTIHDLGEEGKTTYIVMEILEGTDLKSIIADGVPLTLEKKLNIASQIADGLNHAHKQGIVHRDIKPGNIHVSNSGNVKILDFGIARIPSSDLTRIGARLGTPVYMSPEQIRGESYDERSDLFSTGIVFYELITYVHPFRDKKISKTLDNILYQEQFPFSEQFPEAPPGLWPIVSTCLAKAPEKRYATMADLGRACRALLNELTLARQKMATELEAATPWLRQAAANPSQSDRLFQIFQDAQRLLERDHEPDYVALLRVSRAVAAEMSGVASASFPRSPSHEETSLIQPVSSAPAAIPEGPYAAAREPVQSPGLTSSRSSQAPVQDLPPLRTRTASDMVAPAAPRAPASSVTRDELERRGREMVQTAEQLLRDDELDEALDQLRAAIGILGPKDDLIRMLADTRKRNDEKKRARVSTLLEVAKAAIASGQHDKAIQAVDELLGLEPGKAEALEIRRQIHTQLEAERAHEARRQEGEREKALGFRLLADRKYQDSLKALRRAAEILPDDPEIKPGIDGAEDGLRAQEFRARLQVELAEAVRLLQARAFDQARVQVNRVLELSPGDSEATELLARIDGAQAEERRQASAAALLRQSREALGRRDFDAALSAADEIRALDPSNPQIDALLEQISTAKENVRRAEEVAKLLTKAEDALVRGDLDEAEYQSMQALLVIPEHPGARDSLKRTDLARKERAKALEIENLVGGAEQALKQGNLEQSESLTRQIQVLDPQNGKARDLLARVAQAREKIKSDRIRDLLEQAQAAWNAGEILRSSNYARDVLLLDAKNATALKMLADVEETQRKRKAEEVAGILSRGRIALGQQHFEEAAELAGNVLAQDPKNREAKALLKEIDKSRHALEKEKKKAGKARAEEKVASPAAQDAPADLDTTIKLKRPKHKKTILVAGFAALLVVALGVVLGIWYWRLHRKTGPDPAVSLAEARAVLTQGKFDQAIEIARSVLAVSPGNVSAETLIAEAAKQKRDAMIAGFMSEAADLHTRNQLEESNRVLQRVLDIDPANQQALALRSEIEAQISSGKSKEEQDREIQKWADNAETLLSAGKLAEAQGEIDKIEHLRPDTPMLPALRKHLAERAAQLERGKSERAEVSKKQKRINELSLKVSELFRQGKYLESQGALEQWLAEAPEDVQAQGLRNQVFEALRNVKIYESTLAAKQYDAALQALARLELLNPADPNTAEMRKRAESSKAAAKATFAIYRLGEPGVLTLDNQPIGNNGEVEGEVVKAGPHKLIVQGIGDKSCSLLREFVDGQNLVFVYDLATAEIRQITATDKDTIARRKQREEVRRYPADHLHGFLKGKCTGVLLISGVRVEYKPDDGDHKYSIPFKNLKLTVREDKLDLVETPGGRLLQFKVHDAKQAGFIGKLFSDLGKLEK